jgi:uncharacterized membrane protein YgcG
MPRDTDRFAGRAVTVTVLLGMTLAGCSDLYFDRRESVMFSSGDAVAANVAMQTIDPWPAVAADRKLHANGERMQRAIERYRQNKTTPLQTTSTSSAQFNQPGSGSGNGSGGGGSSGSSGGTTSP